MTTPTTPARTRQLPGWFLAVTVTWCAAMALLPWLTARVLGDALPDPVATHWGADGVANEFTPLAGVWVFPLVFTALMTAFLLGLGAALRQLRAMAPVAVGTATMIGVLMAGSLVAQADGTAAASSADLAAVAGIVVGLVVGALWGLLLRRFAPRPVVGRRPGTLPPVAARLPLDGSARVSWLGPTRTSPATRAVTWLVVLPFLVLGGVFAAYRQWVMLGLMAAIGLALVLLMVAFLHATVVIDSIGVRVRSLGRFTPVAIPLSEIESADVVQVHWGEFGGIGLRARIDIDGSWGLVTSSGEAVRIQRAGTGPFFLTVSPAAEAASALNALVVRDAT